jgi:hypothetical protein
MSVTKSNQRDNPAAYLVVVVTDYAMGGRPGWM